MYEADKDQLVPLQERFAMLEKQYDAIIEERRVAEEEKARKMEEERKQNQAAKLYKLFGEVTSSENSCEENQRNPQRKAKVESDLN